MPTKPSFTEKSLPDQSGKVFIVTESTSGVGLELASILYSRNARIYIAARSAEKAEVAISQLKQQNPHSKGSLVFLKLDLGDLTTVGASAKQFLAQESRLDVLWNNAGVMVPPQGSQTQQGYELQLGTNCVGPFLFTKLLTPLMSKTAQSTPAGSVRVVWVSSSAAKNFAPKGGIEMDNLDYHREQGQWHKYGLSKTGNIFYAREFARRYKAEGIISVALDPGNLKTDLYQHVPWWQKVVMNLVLKDPVYGAYTELSAGLSPKVELEDNGMFIEPWGCKGTLRDDIEESSRMTSEGGTGRATEFWEWTEKQVAAYV